MEKGRSQKLKMMSRTRRLARFFRRFEESSVHGYVLDVGPKFFLVAIVNHEIWFDGFECFRINDVNKLTLDPYAKFAEAALRKRGDRAPKKPRMRLGSVEELLLSASKMFPLVTIHLEQIDPDVCWIGRVASIEDGLVSLLEINPDASWDPKPKKYKMADITRISFGGDYENALHLVGGEPAV